MSSIDVSKVKLFQLRALVAVTDCGSFGGAAALLDLSQSAVSHAIASLEEELGVVLLARGRQGTSLTYVGEQIISEVRQMLSLLDNVLEKVNHSKGLQAGQVRIASIRSIATHRLPSVIASFRQQFPQISITLTKYFDHVQVATALRNRTADIGLMDVYDRAGLRVTELGLDDYVALLPASVPFHDSQVSWQQLSQYPLIMPAPHDQGYNILRQYIKRSPVPLTTAYEINEDSTIVSMVAQELGVALLPHLAALPLPDRVRVCRPPEPLARLLGAAVLEDALHSPAVFVFLDAIGAAGWGNNLSYGQVK